MFGEEVEIPGLIDIKLPENHQNNYFWKYVDIHKLISFLYNEELFFTRLDKFNDPLEGLKESLIAQKNIIGKLPLDPTEYNPLLPPEFIESSINQRKLMDYEYPRESAIAQKTQFVNCWYYGNRESMAMWDLYSNRDSVVIKIGVKEFVAKIKEASRSFLETIGNRAHILGDLIQYFELNPYSPSPKVKKVKYAGMKKDVSFEHEKEYRFLISILTKWAEDEDVPSFTIPIQNNIEFEILAHPLMESWKFENVKILIRKSNFDNVVVKKSSIELRI